MGTLTCRQLAGFLTGLNNKEIALKMSTLISSGTVPIGEKLPSVRSLAEALHVSPATVSSAWSILRRNKVISGRGRNGVWVCDNKTSPRPRRFETVGNFGQRILADLTFAAPDPELLPDIGEAILRSAGAPGLNSYVREPITPSLKAAIQARWPYPAEATMAINGGFEGIHLAVQALVMHSAVVAVEDPTPARVLDILDNIGAHIVPVICDDNGPLPDALKAAMKQKPAAFIYQPRTHAVTGHSLSAERMDVLSDILRDSETLIIEDDGVGDISNRQPISMGNQFPSRTIHVCSYSKSLGPDLRLAVLSGSFRVVEQIQAYRNFGACWTSRILQNAAAWMLNDPQCNAMVANARRVYAERRNSLVEALRRRNVHLVTGDGLCLWIPVPSEQFAMITLAARGFAVFPGTRFSIVENPHIRVGTGTLTGYVEELAEAIYLSINGS